MEAYNPGLPATKRRARTNDFKRKHNVKRRVSVSSGGRYTGLYS